MNGKKTFLIVLDGLGINPNPLSNSWAEAAPPYLNQLLAENPNSTLVTHGLRVGLPEGQMGNSEVGHLNIGAGRVIQQSLVRIDIGLQPETLRQSIAYNNFITLAAQTQEIHLLGLLSDGGVHSHLNHLLQLLKIISIQDEINSIKLHIITDGRDTSPQGGLAYLATLISAIDLLHTHVPRLKIHIASLSGRFYTMDRDQRWERTQRAVDAIVGGKNTVTLSPLDYLKQRYEAGETDEFVTPVSFSANGSNAPPSLQNASLLCWNFRADRMRQITQALFNPLFSHFHVHSTFRGERSLTFTEYDEALPLPLLFPSQPVRDHLGEMVAKNGLAQLRAAETEKYPHVTYFFNGGSEEQLPREERIMVPSPKDVATYDLKPEMSAYELTDAVVKRIVAKDDLAFGVLNYANCDMVGHTGNLAAATKAVETVSFCLAKLVPILIDHGWTIMLIADHGNCEQMVNYADGSPHTSHTKYPVPIILVNGPPKFGVSAGGALCDVAPTILNLLAIPVPADMTGTSLLTTLTSN
jgi:2,3-bisphosphoglycerate-independent phosphoglycerate mutase